MDKSRQQFEEEYRKHSTLDEVDIFKIDSESDDYYYLATRWAWRWWQASRESLEVELPKKCNTSIAGDTKTKYYFNGINEGVDKCKQILISNGVKIKNG
ncbi:hypothetical protein [Providencia rettgeri]|uniref:hypothetical protein n=2 Tax=Providencia rettgeri TaxID=587 RepID=UPI001EE6FD4A|nr:hypothetical protein [Providencia rettgeri]MCG5275792.1 hypothetical protein [Providencia rettgeri]